MSNAPRINFQVLDTLIVNYYQITPELVSRHNSSPNPRADRYLIEAELATLDFLQGELKALQLEIDARGNYLADKLDSTV